MAICPFAGSKKGGRSLGKQGPVERGGPRDDAKGNPGPNAPRANGWRGGRGETAGIDKRGKVLYYYKVNKYKKASGCGDGCKNKWGARYAWDTGGPGAIPTLGGNGRLAITSKRRTAMSVSGLGVGLFAPARVVKKGKSACVKSGDTDLRQSRK